MTIVYSICAAIGATILVCQFALTLFGFGDADDIETGDGADLDAAGYHPDSTWLFGVISFRTIVAALAFFGLAGLASDAAGLELLPSLMISLAAGVAAMYGVHSLMRLLHHLRAEGTADIHRAVGQTGAVYLRIPADGEGNGKVTVTVQGRSVELLARSEGEALPTGARVVVTRVLDGETVEVVPAREVETA